MACNNINGCLRNGCLRRWRRGSHPSGQRRLMVEWFTLPADPVSWVRLGRVLETWVRLGAAWEKGGGQGLHV